VTDPVPIVEFDRLIQRVGAKTILDTGVDSRRLMPGEVALCVGVSGAGKSTLLTLLAGLALPREGTIAVSGTRWSALSEAQRDQHRARYVGYLPQREHLLGTLNVLDNVLLPRYFLTRTRTALDGTHALRLLHALDVAEHAWASVSALSRGQSQRVCLARALINSPALLLADEPTANLDDASAQRVVERLLTHAQRARAALIIATHDARIAAHIPTAQRWELIPC
jgi:putative ABC transport system ATP-binding protein